MPDTPAGYVKTALLVSGCLLATAIGWPTSAETPAHDETRDIEALAHADTIELAWRTLAAHIERQSTTATSWSGNTPPAATGWDADWTLRGLGGRYCDDLLVVFADRPTLKGVGANQRSVRLAPHVRAVREGRVYPPLHWLAAGVAEGDLGRASLSLPACMASLPLNRVALAGQVVDPWRAMTQRIVRRETEERVCPSGQHGAGQTWERQWTLGFNGRGEPIGTEQAGTWGIKVDRCRDDYTVAELYTVACLGGTGEQVWRRHRTVTSDGETYTIDPVPVSSTCMVDPPPPPPTPVINSWTSTSYQYRTVGCPSTHAGSGRRHRRTVTQSYESTQWPWDTVPTQRLVSVGHSNWIMIRDDCERIPPPPPPPPDEDDQDDTPGSEDNGHNNEGGGDRGTGIDVDGDGRSDFSTAQEAADAGFSASDMSLGFGDPVPGSTPSTDPSNSNDGDRGGGGPGGDAGGSVGGGPGGQQGSGDRGR